jgi:hypothetical protein
MAFPIPKNRTGLLWGALALGAAAVTIGLMVLFGGGNPSPESPEHVSFQISAGSSSGTYFPLGEFMAAMLSHPPGVGRCEAANVCGPPGVIVNARTTEGSIENLRDVDNGTSQSGFAQADVVADAMAGRGPFAKTGRTRQIRLIAELYPEAVHVVAAHAAGLLSVSDLKGKRVSLSTEGSGTIVAARAVLAAYGLSERRIVPVYQTPDRAAEMLQEGKLDAFFFVGGTPVRIVQELLQHGDAALLPIDGVHRDKLLAAEPTYSPYVIAQGTYSGSPPVETVSVGALWFTNAKEPEDLIYAMTKALYNPANRAQIDAAFPGNRWMMLNSATKDPVAPFHPGAARYFREAGILAPKDSDEKR